MCPRLGAPSPQRAVRLVVLAVHALVDLAGCVSVAEREDQPALALTASPAAGPVETLTPAAAEAELVPVQRARLAYLFEADQLLAERWRFLPSAEICVLLVSREREWIVNCDAAPAGSFRRLAEPFRGRAVYTRRAGNYRAGGKELDVARLLERTPAAAHVDQPGGQASDLAPEHPWLLLGSLEALREYHPAFQEAITDEWLSVALHELYHVRQLLAPSFADELERINTGKLTPQPLEQLFLDELPYRRRVQREYRLLIRSAADTQLTASGARAVLRRWQQLYRTRRADLAARPDGSRLVESDRLFSYVEGVARYVESMFLIDASQHPPRPIPSDTEFQGFARFAGRGYAGTNNRQLDAQYYYAVGFHLALLLDRIDPGWKDCVHIEPGWLFGLSERILRSPASTPVCSSGPASGH